jgi:protein-S-isoprenylcysteine O-methyltransferase Ste14
MMRILMWVLFLGGGSMASFWLDAHLFKIWLINTWFHAISFVLGLMIFKLVMNSSRNTGRLLARLGREGNLTWMETNKLVTTGYYACMRHPMHLGLFLLPLATAFLVGSLSFILIIAPLEILFMITMIKLVEEPQAIRKFGGEYLRYRERVPMFSFRFECLQALFGKSDSNENLELD